MSLGAAAALDAGRGDQSAADVVAQAIRANAQGDVHPRAQPPSIGNEARTVPSWVATMQAWQPDASKLEAERIEVAHAVHGLIRAGKVGALVAAGGTGKTTLLLILAVCHATGRPFLGQEVKGGTFVILSNDDPLEDLEGALIEVVRAMQLSGEELALVSARVRLHSLQGAPGIKTFTASAAGTVFATGLEELLMQAVSGITDLVGIALDTLRQFSGGSSNDEQVIKLTVAGATDFALRTEAYVILPHHTGKQNYRDGIADMYCGSGSAAIADNCRFVLLLQTANWEDIESKVRRTGQERGDPLVLISTRGSLLMRPMEPIFLHRDGFYVGRVAGASLSRAQQEDKKDRDVLEAVRAGADSKNQIVLRVGGKRTAILARVDDLQSRGHLRSGSQSGSSKYVVSASGAVFLESR